MEVPFLDLKAPYLELKEEFDAAYQRVMESGWYISDAYGGDLKRIWQINNYPITELISSQILSLLIGLHLHQIEVHQVFKMLLEVFKYDTL